jgi:lysophospholipase L1-like esterase
MGAKAPRSGKPKGAARPTVRTSWRAGVLLAAGGVAFALLLAEIAIRAVSPGPPRPRLTDPPGYPPIDHIAGNLYIYKPGIAWAHVYDTRVDRRNYFGETGRVDYRTNNLGLRGGFVSGEKPAGVRRILCLGDSLTFGEGVREKDIWPERLRSLLGPGVDVVNAGIQGYDFNHEALYLLLHGRQLDPDVVVVAFFMNDAMPFGSTVEHHQLMTEAPLPESGIGRASALWGFFERRRFAARQTERYLDDLRESFRSEIWVAVKGRMPKLREMGEHDGFKVIALLFPLLQELDAYPLQAEHEQVRAAFLAAGIDVVDLLEALQGRKAADLRVHPVDPHPNEIVHRIAAEKLAHALVMQATDSR